MTIKYKKSIYTCEKQRGNARCENHYADDLIVTNHRGHKSERALLTCKPVYTRQSEMIKYAIRARSSCPPP